MSSSFGRSTHPVRFTVTLVNPEISSGLPIPELNRNPAPASRPELYATPATEASDIAFNPVRQPFTSGHQITSSF